MAPVDLVPRKTSQEGPPERIAHQFYQAKKRLANLSFTGHITRVYGRRVGHRLGELMIPGRLVPHWEEGEEYPFFLLIKDPDGHEVERFSLPINVDKDGEVWWCDPKGRFDQTWKYILYGTMAWDWSFPKGV